MRKSVLVSFLLLLYTVPIMSQQRHTISGTIKDSITGETMIGVYVYVRETGPESHSICNEYGFYSMTLLAGKHDLIFSIIGYKPDTLHVNLNENIRLDHNMLINSVKLNEVIVSSEKKNDNVRRANIGVERVDVKATGTIPVIFGEKDILKTIQLFPGVKPAGEGSSGFYVRGGSSDQNLILLDEAPVYNASHLLGFFSTFNSDAIKDASIIKGNIPAQYGGRLSSVLDVKMNDGNNHDYSVSGGIGLISSRLSIQGPIVNDKSSFMICARRSYADLFLQMTDKYKGNILNFYDLNGKVNFKINDKNKIFISGYLGRDVLGLENDLGINWGNMSATLRWNTIINPKIFLNTSLIYSDYNYDVNIVGGESEFNVNSEIQDWNLKEEFQYFLGSNNSIKFGFNSIYHKTSPNRFDGDGISAEKKQNRFSFENSVFINNTLKVFNSLTIDYGLRLSAYTILGKDTYNIYKNNILTDSIKLASGEYGRTYLRLEPRLQFSIMLDESSSLKGGYSRNI